MIQAFATFFTQLLVFAISAILGVAGFVGLRGVTTELVDNKPSETTLEEPAKAPVTTLNARPVLLAKTIAPVDIAGDALGNFLVLDKDGSVTKVVPDINGNTTTTHFASLGDAATDETIGFSALALHPHFLLKGSNGYGKFYAVVAEKMNSGDADFRPQYGDTGEHHQDVLYSFQTEDPLLNTFRGTRSEILRFSQPGAENNLKGLAFDHSGYLYIGVGDGREALVETDAPSENASSLTSAFGKVLRIDPAGDNSKNGNYGIPKTNPFYRVSGSIPELWAFGLRAPHSLHFDPFQKHLLIGDEMLGGHEEVNISNNGGEHFGWDLSERFSSSTGSTREQVEKIITAPGLEIGINPGRADGALIYRGENFPSLAGKILISSKDGIIHSAPSNRSEDNSKVAAIALPGLQERTLSAMKTAPNGELIILCEDGSIFEIRKQTSLGTEGRRNRPLFCEAATAPRSSDEAS